MLEAKVDAEKNEREKLQKKLDEREEADRKTEAAIRVEALKAMGFTAEDAEDLSQVPDSIYKKLTAFKSQAAVADLFKEIGHGERGEDTAEGQIVKIAKEIRKADPKLSEEEAEAEAWERHPELYERHLNETKVQ